MSGKQFAFEVAASIVAGLIVLYIFQRQQVK